MILGVDPGLASTGYAVVGGALGRPRVEAWGVIRTTTSMPHALRLREIHDRLAEVLMSHPCDGAAIESWYIHKTGTAAMGMGEARGAAQVALACHDVPVTEYSPNTVKQAVTGSGRADKDQVRDMVARLTGVTARSDHAADAIAIAICHLSTQAFAGAVRRSG